MAWALTKKDQPEEVKVEVQIRKLYHDYHVPQSNSIKALLQIAGLEFETIQVEILKRENKEEWFTKINPLMKVPTFT